MDTGTALTLKPICSCASTMMMSGSHEAATAAPAAEEEADFDAMMIPQSPVALIALAS
jgi:hypothetical protein